MPQDPAEALRRVLRTSRLNGWSVAVCAGLCALVSLAFGELAGASIGILVSAGGALEIYGNRRLRRRDPGGVRWLVRSQLVVLAAIGAYASARLFSFDPEYVREIITPSMRASLDEMGLTADEIIPLVSRAFHLLYGGLLLVTLLYQGGVALYYRRQARAVAEALNPPPLLPPRI